MSPDFSAFAKSAISISSALEGVMNTYKNLSWFKDFEAQAKLSNNICKWTDSYNHLNQLHNPAMKAFCKSTAFMPTLLPSAAIEKMTSIFAEQTRFTSMLEGIQSAARYHSALNQIKDLQFALGTSSGSIARIFAAQQNWNALAGFSNLVSNAADWSDKINENQPATKADLEAIKKYFFDLFLVVEQKIGQVGKDKLSRVLIWITIISFLTSIKPTIESYMSHPELATQEDINQLRKEIHMQTLAQLTASRSHRSVLRRCSIYLKPRTNISTTAHLSPGTDVIVLNANHEWLYISFINPTDGLAETGWIMKKYLSCVSSCK